MRCLSPLDILNTWERGQYLSPLDRALALLMPVCSEITLDKLRTLTISQRDDLLFRLYEKTFGPEIKGTATCPGCSERIEFTTSARDIKAEQKGKPYKEEYGLQLTDEGVELILRLPNSDDLAAVGESEDIENARNLLMKRCVLKATHNGELTSIDELPTEVIYKTVEYMADCEPFSEVLVAFQCPVCNHRWHMIFDIAVFLWVKISLEAKRLLKEVHTLASVYKWSEADILSMSSFRRQLYINEMP